MTNSQRLRRRRRSRYASTRDAFATIFWALVVCVALPFLLVRLLWALIRSEHRREPFDEDWFV